MNNRRLSDSCHHKAQIKSMGKKCTSFITPDFNKLAFVIHFISHHNIFIHWLPTCSAAKCCCGCCYLVNNAFSTARWWDVKVSWKIYCPAWDSHKLSEGFRSSRASVGWKKKKPRLSKDSLWGLITTYARLRVGLLPQRDAVCCVESLMNGYHAPCLLPKQHTWQEPLPLSPQACHYWTPAVVHVLERVRRITSIKVAANQWGAGRIVSELRPSDDCCLRR